MGEIVSGFVRSYVTLFILFLYKETGDYLI